MSPTNTTDRFSNERRYRFGDDESHRQLTPAYVLEPVRLALGGIDLDPCTEPENPTGADHFFTVDEDGLRQAWRWDDGPQSIYCNPPYGTAKKPWVRRCIDAGIIGQQKVVLLIPSHTDTRDFHDALDGADTVCFIKGRVKFGVLRPVDRFGDRRQEAASHPSALIGWNVDLAPCAALGKVVDLSSPAVSRAEGDSPKQPVGPYTDGRRA